MVRAASRLGALSLLLLAYAGLSVLFWLALVPQLSPLFVPFASSVAGPPAMLLWGREALVPFAIASTVLFFLLYRALPLQQRHRLWLAAALAVWLISGWLSYAVSI